MPFIFGYDSEETPDLGVLVGQLSSGLAGALHLIDALRQRAVALQPLNVSDLLEGHQRTVEAVVAIDAAVAAYGQPLADAWSLRFAQPDQDMGPDYEAMKAALVPLIDAIYSILPKDGSGRVLAWNARNETTRAVTSAQLTLDAGQVSAFNALWAAVLAEITLT